MDVLAVVIVIIGIIWDAYRKFREVPTKPTAQQPFRPAVAPGLEQAPQSVRPTITATARQPQQAVSMAAAPTATGSLAGPQRKSTAVPAAASPKRSNGPQEIRRSTAPMSDVAVKFAEERRLKEAEVAQAFESYTFDNQNLPYGSSIGQDGTPQAVTETPFYGSNVSATPLTPSAFLTALLMSQMLGPRRGKGRRFRTVI